MTRQALVLRYAFFAALATIANLATQQVLFLAGNAPLTFAAAIAAGTGVGLVVKYVLDKRWIFYDAGEGLRDHSRKFSLYVVMGLLTTAIFWGMETAFWLATHQPLMRNVGAVIGLTIGYVVKYRLDRKFVFTDAIVPVGPRA